MANDTHPPGDRRLHFPATARNRGPILDALAPHLAGAARALEVASGSGEHVAYLAPRFPDTVWLPSDPAPPHRASIAAWTAGLENVEPPRDLDVTASPWGLAPVDAVLCVNLIHIAPWAACLGVLAGAAEVLCPDGFLYLYGPFTRDGRHTADSNARFDANLRAQNPAWGVRDLGAVDAAARDRGLAIDATAPMPANNLSVFLRRKV
ncbi:MAG: DUF938 domain-containing protein, partial [Rhodospirillaceae bacterium]